MNELPCPLCFPQRCYCGNKPLVGSYYEHVECPRCHRMGHKLMDCPHPDEALKGKRMANEDFSRLDLEQLKMRAISEGKIIGAIAHLARIQYKYDANKDDHDFSMSLVVAARDEYDHMRRQLEDVRSLLCKTCYGSGDMMIAIDDAVPCPECKERDALPGRVGVLEREVAARETIIAKLGRAMLQDDEELRKFVGLLDLANKENERLRALNTEAFNDPDQG